MIRLLIFALSRWWGLIILGAIPVIFGIYYGVGSHQVTYRSVGQETVAHFLSGDGSSLDQNGYLQLENDPNLYVLNESDFTPTLNGNSFGDGDVISFIYRPDSATSFDVKATNTSTHLQGNFYTIEQITVAGSNGQSPKVYTSSEYSRNPKGFYQNNWWPSSPNNWWHIGGGLVVFGLIIVGLALVVPMLRGKNKSKAQQAFNAIPTARAGAPVGAQPQVNAYGQPYQNPNQYPQYPQRPYQNPAQYQQPQYPPQPGQYNLPPQYPQYPQQQGQQYWEYPQQGGSYEPTQRADPPRN